MKGVRSLCVALLAVCAVHASAQTLYKRPANYSEDCLPATTRATTFAAVFPSDFFVSGGKISSQDTSTTVRDIGLGGTDLGSRRHAPDGRSAESSMHV